MPKKRSIVFATAAAVMLFWLIDTLFHWWLLGHQSFLDELLLGGARHTLYLRIAVTTVFVIGGLTMLYVSARHKNVSEQALFQADLLNHIGDHITATDLEGRIIYVNDIQCEKLGMSRAELIGQKVTAYGEDPQRGATQQEIIDHTLQHGSWSGDVVNIATDGTELPLYCRTWLVYGHDGKPRAICGVSTDVSKRKEAEAEIKQERDRAQRYLDVASVMIVALDRDGNITLINRRGCEVLKCEPGEIVGKNWFDTFLPEDVRARVRDIFGQLIGGELEPVEYAENSVVTAKGEERLIEWHNAIVRDESGRIIGTLASGTDVTERRQAEEDRLRLEAQIQHAQKLESLGVLAGGIAHDFNNLLMGIMGNAGLALMELPPESPARPTIEQVEKAALRAADLTKQMLAYSGRGQFVIEPINLSALVEEMTHLLKAVISKKASLRFDFEPNLPAIEVDATQIRQIVMNLITNASDALGDQNGILSVSTSTIDADADYLASAYLNDDLVPGHYACVEVSDTGQGMDTETISKIFDPFFSTKEAGRGLGLAAVIGIVRGHMGTIKVYSEPGRGTSFKILLPCTDKPSPQPSRPARQSSAAERTGTILVADDEDGCRRVTANMLQAVGFTVLTAADGSEAVDVFRQHRDEIVLVILDLVMPRMGGEETFRELRRMCPDVRVLLTSGYNHQEASEGLIGRGLAGFIQKPYRPPDLLATVDRILGA
jgi:PAS domain S-box-containing protein